jgi:hypothetical protein
MMKDITVECFSASVKVLAFKREEFENFLPNQVLERTKKNELSKSKFRVNMFVHKFQHFASHVLGGNDPRT